MPEITIGIPFYNCEKYLVNCIKSVFAQTFTDWELILVDDGSTDRSLAIAQSIKDPRVKVFSDGVNKGIGARRRQIVDLTDSKYLAWWDADDIFHPKRLEEQYNILQNNEKIGIVDNSFFTMNANLNVFRLIEKKEGLVDKEKIKITPTIANGTTLGRTALYKKYNYDPKLGRSEDWDVWIRAMGEYDYYHINQPLYFRLHAYEGEKPRLDREFSNAKYASIIYLKHGFSKLGFLKAIKMVLRTYITTCGRVFFISIGKHNIFKIDKINTLTPEKKQQAESILKQIIETKVPGIDD
ncbi:MAG: glycosyltransferase family 2 protein [Armatimonadota bacterium]